MVYRMIMRGAICVFFLFVVGVGPYAYPPAARATTGDCPYNGNNTRNCCRWIFVLASMSLKGPSMFQSVDDVIAGLDGQNYICNKNVATVVYLGTTLQKPILVEGPAGVGKTELGKVLAGALGMELIRLQCYKGLDEAKAL